MNTLKCHQGEDKKSEGCSWAFLDMYIPLSQYQIFLILTLSAWKVLYKITPGMCFCIEHLSSFSVYLQNLDVLFTVCFTLNASAFCIILWDFTCVSSFLSWILADEAFGKLTYLFLLLLCNFHSWNWWQNQQTTPRNLSFQKVFLRGSSSNDYWIRIWLALVFSFNYEFFLSIMNLEIKKKVLVVFGLSYTDLHVFKMKRPIGRAKNQSFISISLVISSSTCTLSLNSPIPVELLWFFTLPSLIDPRKADEACSQTAWGWRRENFLMGDTYVVNSLGTRAWGPQQDWDSLRQALGGWTYCLKMMWSNKIRANVAQTQLKAVHFTFL